MQSTCSTGLRSFLYYRDSNSGWFLIFFSLTSHTKQIIRPYIGYYIFNSLYGKNSLATGWWSDSVRMRLWRMMDQAGCRRTTCLWAVRMACYLMDSGCCGEREQWRGVSRPGVHNYRETPLSFSALSEPNLMPEGGMKLNRCVCLSPVSLQAVSPYRTILHLVIYVQCQCSVPGS